MAHPNDFKPGARFKVAAGGAERYPFFSLDEGATGTVEHVEGEGDTALVFLKMDAPVPCCEEWDNCLVLGLEGWGAGLSGKPGVFHSWDGDEVEPV